MKKKLKLILSLFKNKKSIDDFQLNTPLKWSKAITAAIISLSTFGLIFSFLAKIEEVIVNKGDLESIEPLKNIRSLSSGIISNVFVKEGDLVDNGDILITINSERERNNIKSLSQKIIEETDIHKLDLELLSEKKTSLQNSFKIYDLIFKKHKYLYEQGAYSYINFLESKENLDNIISQIKQLNLQGENLEKKFTSRMIDYKIKLNELNNILSEKEIKSPIKGTVFDLKVNIPGMTISSEKNQPLMKIVPQDLLIAKIFISSKDIAFVKIGQNAEVRLDAYPFSEFGSIKGKLKTIGKETLITESEKAGTFYPATVALDNQYLIKSENKLPILSGQTVQVNLIVREKRVITLLTDVIAMILDPLKSIRSKSS